MTTHPFPNQAKPEKAVCYFTEFGDLEDDHKARLHLKASLHAIDCFFMSVRRRLNMLERPVATSSRPDGLGTDTAPTSRKTLASC